MLYRGKLPAGRTAALFTALAATAAAAPGNRWFASPALR